MGYPEVQDGQPRRVRAGAGVPGGPLPAPGGSLSAPDGPLPDKDPGAVRSGHDFAAAPTAGATTRDGRRAAPVTNGTNGTTGPGTRPGAHRAPSGDGGLPPRGPRHGTTGPASASRAPGFGTD